MTAPSRATESTGSSGSAVFTGTLRLTRLALRHDRVRLPVWLAGIVGLLTASVSSVLGAYSDPEQRVAYTKIAASPAARMFNGPAPGTDIGAIAFTETFATVAVLTALMSAMAVVRHTRHNEETGRTELIGSAVVGRHAPLTAALLLAVLINGVLASVISVVLMLNDLDPAGSWAAGLSWGAVGVVFAAVAAVAAQLAETSRGANGLAGAVLGIAFVVRAVGDVLGDTAPDGLTTDSMWVSWLSPFGWGMQVRPFRDDAWWVLGTAVAATVLLMLLAYRLTAHRDLGGGLLAVRKGRPTARRSLLRPLGLAWRLQRGILAGWLAVMIVYGATIGALGEAVRDMIADNPALAEYLTAMGGSGDIGTIYLGAMMSLLGTVAAAYPLPAMLRMRAEEADGHLEPLLATAVGRPRWMASHIIVGVLGSALLLTVAGATTGLTYGLVMGDTARWTAELTGAALVQLPAVLVMAAFVIALVALLPRWAVPAAWGLYALWFVMSQFGELLELPQLVLDLSPFTHVPAVPATDPTAAPIIALLLTALLVGAAGVAAFRRRDLRTA